MSTIITPFDFIGENAIAQVQIVTAVEENLQWFINKYEPKFLKILLGDDLYQEFITGLAVLPTPDQKWLDLRDNTDIKPMLIDYIYYWYTKNDVTHTTGTAEVMAKNENSTITNRADKMARAWNEMVSMAMPFTVDKTIYPSYVEPAKHHDFYWCAGNFDSVNAIFRKVNTFNI